MLPLAGRGDVGSRTGCRHLLFIDVALRDGHGMSLALDMSTDTRAGSFLVGAALALAWTQRAPWLRALHGLGQRISLVACILFLGWGSWVFRHGASRPVFTLTWVTVSVAAALIVVTFLGDGLGRWCGLVSSPVTTYIGRRSYGLYLWHYVWLTWLGRIGLLGVPVALAATFASARIIVATRRATGTGAQAPLHLDLSTRPLPRAGGPSSGLVALPDHAGRMTTAHSPSASRTLCPEERLALNMESFDRMYVDEPECHGSRPEQGIHSFIHSFSLCSFVGAEGFEPSLGTV